MCSASDPGAVCFILGLAGSGKSHLAAEMNWDKHFDENFLHDLRQQQELLERLRKGQRCTVSEAAYVAKENREALRSWLRNEVPDAQVTWICFENDLESANWNCRHRTNKGSPDGHIRINEWLHQRYSYPDGSEIRAIHRVPMRPD